MSTLYRALLVRCYHSVPDPHSYRDVLPYNDKPITSRPVTPSISLPARRILRRVIVALLVGTALTLSWYFGFLHEPAVTAQLWLGAERPPLYERFHVTELALPQHNLDLPYPEGRSGKYLRFVKHSTDLGWNNVMQELMVNALAAYVVNRTFVFYNYQWKDDNTEYSFYNGRLIPSQIPITAYLSGPVAGQPFHTVPDFPRSVNEEFFHQVCPHPKSLTLEALEGNLDLGATAESIIMQFSALLENEDPCVELAFQPFHWMVFGDVDRMLDVWPRYAASPILTEFRWSPLIEAAFDSNRERFAASNASEPPLSTLPADMPSATRYGPLPGLLALHIRRGDYAAHCTQLAIWHAQYTAFNSFPGFQDKLRDAVPDEAEGAQRTVLVRPHCWPSIAEIVARANAVRATPAGAGLQYVYVLTNGDREWVDRLVSALRATGHWRIVASGRDLTLDLEQRYVAQAVDMLIGQRAQVLVGNGWSSMTSQMNLLRMANGFPPDSCRFW